MKKAKIMLTALAVLAVAGGALAFKAQKTMTGNLRCTIVPTEPTTTFILGDCPVPTYSTTLVNFTWGYCTLINAPATDPCFKLKVKFTQ